MRLQPVIQLQKLRPYRFGMVRKVLELQKLEHLSAEPFRLIRIIRKRMVRRADTTLSLVLGPLSAALRGTRLRRLNPLQRRICSSEKS